VNFERSPENIKKSVGIGHQAINLKLMAIKFEGKNHLLPDDETHKFLKGLEQRKRIPWEIIHRNLPRQNKEGDKIGFLILSEDEYQVNEAGGKVYQALKLSFIQSNKVIFNKEVYEIPQIFVRSNQ